MTIEEFLMARIAELEERIANYHLPREDWLGILRMCNAQRALIEWHKKFPVLAVGEPKYEMKLAPDSVDELIYSATQQSEWIDRDVYKHRFGKDAPATPFLLTWARQYQDHPDFQAEWA